MNYRGMRLQSRRTIFFSFLIFLFLTNLGGSGLVPIAFAEGTRTWEQSKFEELIKGTATGVAIRSSGGLELAPAFKTLSATPSTYIWAIVAYAAGHGYAATVAPARVYRITPGGQVTIIFEPQELQVQALQVQSGGGVYAGTAPGRERYKNKHKAGGNTRAAK